jgi:ABC-type branched-subunit amino acid transport system ATPase component
MSSYVAATSGPAPRRSRRTPLRAPEAAVETAPPPPAPTTVQAPVRHDPDPTTEIAVPERAGGEPLLSCRGIDMAYGPVQILFDVDFDVERGEIVALLGTNGAGKSTLLKGICGLVKPKRGTVHFQGEDVTSLPADTTTHRGISLMPGGKGVFPTLTVAENLRLAGWLIRKEPERVEAAKREVEELFPILRERADQMAGNLSGGEQQMLALGGALMTRPELLMIDELSLGLAPTIVGQLLEVVREIHRRGTTLVIVEQSVNVALNLAERAVFMEKGQVRFTGPTADLLERPDILRSVFIAGASAGAPDTEEEAVRGGEGAARGVRQAGASPRARGRARRAPVRRRHQALRRHHRGQRGGPRAAAGPDPRPHRPQRRRQDHPDGLHLGVPAHRRGPHPHPRP